MTFYVTISGPKQHGKSTLARKLQNALKIVPYSIDICNFADPLYEICHILTGDNNFLNNKNKAKETIYAFGNNLTGRELLQFIGTDLFRDRLDRNIWKDTLVNRTEGSDIALIPDCRFPNELDLSNLHIWIEDEDAEPQEDNHQSESYLTIMKETAKLRLKRKGNIYKIQNPTCPLTLVSIDSTNEEDMLFLVEFILKHYLNWKIDL